MIGKGFYSLKHADTCIMHLKLITMLVNVAQHDITVKRVNGGHTNCLELKMPTNNSNTSSHSIGNEHAHISTHIVTQSIQVK